jgi:hypothetical protein
MSVNVPPISTAIRTFPLIAGAMMGPLGSARLGIDQLVNHANY